MPGAQIVLQSNSIGLLESKVCTSFFYESSPYAFLMMPRLTVAEIGVHNFLLHSQDYSLGFLASLEGFLLEVPSQYNENNPSFGVLGPNSDSNSYRDCII